MPYQNILAAINLYEDYHDIVHTACQWAQQEHASLTLMSVLPQAISNVPFAYDFEAEMIDKTKQKMQTLLDELDRKDIKTHIDQGSIHHHISDYAKDNNHDLIICGSHARHGLNLLLGSTANGILHTAQCDVLTLRINKKGSRLVQKPYQNILLATDLNPCHKAVSAQAKRIIDTFGSKAHVVSVVPDAAALGGFYLPQMQMELEKQVKTQLANLADDLSISPEHTFFKEGSPKQEILDCAEDINADLVVMGAHTKPNLAGVLLSSTANAVLHHAKQDILVVHTEN